MRALMMAMIILVVMTGVAFGQMAGGHMGSGHMGGGMGSGMAGVGGMESGMMGNTMSHGYLDSLNPLTNSEVAKEAIQAFIDSSNSALQILELWEYETAYVAELSDTNGAKAFDLIADKLTGSVMPEMGFSMMMNASYGRSLYKMPSFRRNINITPDQAKDYAQSFLNNNGLENTYTLGDPEPYPGYYKFHTTMTRSSNFGMDIMVNGYNGGIWMNTLLGVPKEKIF